MKISKKTIFIVLAIIIFLVTIAIVRNKPENIVVY